MRLKKGIKGVESFEDDRHNGKLGFVIVILIYFDLYRSTLAKQ